ncbi:MAG: amino acid permease-associated region [Gemmataceae bacterium]|nr:amino acid permease-associated region [Gemmataceae bacterium]
MAKSPPPDAHPLARGLGFWEATAVNVTQIVGAGVFATIPLILGVLPGAYALLAWLVAGVLILFDSMIWGELGAALPAAGGSYHFLLECYGRSTWGRLMAFLFVWQILISGPLEVGSGLVAAAQFSTGLSPEFKAFDAAHTRQFEVALSDEHKLGAAIGPARILGFGLGVLILVLLYREVATLGRLSVVFLVGVLGVIGWVLLEGAARFDPALAFELPSAADEQPEHFGLALGAGMGLAIYSYLGYYNVCYLGGEVRDPARTIPRSILVSSVAVVILFTLVQLAITGVVPWREAAAAKDNLTAEFMGRVRGPWAAAAVTVCLIGSCFASAFSGALGYSRVPFAAARNGHFFRWFGAVHPRHRIPHRALLLVGGMVLFWSFFSLETIITALIATRILEQFVAQVFAVILLRNRYPDRPRPWRMWLYPLPCVVALVGWGFVYASTGGLFIAIGAGTLVVGAVVFLVWARRRNDWPFRA